MRVGQPSNLNLRAARFAAFAKRAGFDLAFSFRASRTLANFPARNDLQPFTFSLIITYFCVNHILSCLHRAIARQYP